LAVLYHHRGELIARKADSPAQSLPPTEIDLPSPRGSKQ
jgi:hypothetical protein